MIIQTLKIVDADLESGFRIINSTDIADTDVVIDASSGLTVAELREALSARGIDIPDGAKKPELQALLDAPTP